MMPLDLEMAELFEIPGYTPPADVQVYAPMGRTQLRIGQMIRYRYYEAQLCHYRLGVVIRNLGAYPSTGHPHYEISFVHRSSQRYLPITTRAHKPRLSDCIAARYTMPQNRQWATLYKIYGYPFL